MTFLCALNSKRTFMRISSSSCWLIIPLLFLFSSCEEDKDKYVEEEYYSYFKVDSLAFREAGHSRVYNRIYFVYSITVQEQDHGGTLIEATPEEREEIHSFYGEKCIYKGKMYYVLEQNLKPKRVDHPMSAIDWRITDLDIITLADWDESHKAGASVNDLFALSYSYCDSRYNIPLAQLKKGDVMLTDFFTPSAFEKDPPYDLYEDAFHLGVYLYLISPPNPDVNRLAANSCHLEITMKNDLGQTFVCQYPCPQN